MKPPSPLVGFLIVALVAAVLLCVVLCTTPLDTSNYMLVGGIAMVCIGLLVDKLVRLRENPPRRPGTPPFGD